VGNDHLVFVYGTLRKHQTYHGLLKGCECLAEQCWTRGRLYDTGFGYPALVQEARGRVYGEVYRVSDGVLAKLDELEGYQGPGKANEYDRLKQPVHTDQGRMEAYVYVYQSLESHMPEIEGGDWSVYTMLKEKRGHEPLLYFAYGSCMDDGRIYEAGMLDHFQGYGDGERKVRAVLREYRLAFTATLPDGGRADILESPGSVVEGVVYRIDQAAWSYLIKREGAWPINGRTAETPLYRPTRVDVEIKGKKVQVLTFSVVDKGDETAPPLRYIREILRGGQGVLSEEYLRQFKKSLKRKFDLDVVNLNLYD
jgi:gamma-glutamylcyclotransferase (GGCT)/AIG2-like uncharacterized protein YtfP/cation transport regulator ChaC